MSTQWYIKTKNGQRGPYSIEHLQRYVDAGAIRPNAGIGIGDDQWVAAITIAGLDFPAEKVPEVKSTKPLSSAEQKTASTVSTSELEKQVANLNARLGEKDQNLAEVTAKLQKAEQQLAEKNTENETLRNQLDEAVQEQAASREQFEADLAEMDALRAKFDQQSQELAEKERELDDREQQILKHQSELAEQTAALEEQSQANQTFEQELVQREEELNLREQSVTTERENSDEARATADEAIAAADKASATADEAREAAEKAIAEASEAQNQLLERDQLVAELQLALESSNAELQRLQSEAIKSQQALETQTIEEGDRQPSGEDLLQEKKKLLADFAARQDSLSKREAELIRRENELLQRELNLTEQDSGETINNLPTLESPEYPLARIPSAPIPSARRSSKVATAAKPFVPKSVSVSTSPTEITPSQTVPTSTEATSWDDVFSESEIEQDDDSDFIHYDDESSLDLSHGGSDAEEIQTPPYLDDILGSSLETDLRDEAFELGDSGTFADSELDRTNQSSEPATSTSHESVISFRKDALQQRFGPCIRYDVDPDTEMRVDVSVHGPHESRDYNTLVTSGMSDYPITMPNRQSTVRAELVFYATHIDETAITILRAAAKLPYQQGQGLAIGNTARLDHLRDVMSGSDQRDAVYLLPTVDSDSKPIPAKEILGNPIQLFWLVTITEAERKLIDTEGIHKFLPLLEKNNHAVYFDLMRDCYVKRKSWFRRKS